MSMLPIIKDILYGKLPATFLADYLQLEHGSYAFKTKLRRWDIAHRILKPTHILFDFIVQCGTKEDKKKAWKEFRRLVKRRKKYSTFDLVSFKKCVVYNIISYEDWEK